MIALHLFLLLLALMPALSALYLLVLTCLSGDLSTPTPQQRNLRFDILVPAHDEETVIAATIESLQALDWPKESYRIIVIADNCTDATPNIARQQGASVVERCHATLRGKGHAIAFGAQHSAKQQFADALVIVDADSLASPNLLAAFAARIEQGAQALQANYGVSNPNASWRTRLMTIAYSAFHAVRGRARERLGVSCGLRGNGMAFTQALLATHPLQTFSLAEDVEQGVILGLHGIRVWHVDEAHIDAEIPIGGKNTESQRARWELGRLQLAQQYAGRLLCNMFKARNKLSLDLALDLITPPLSHQVLLNGLLLATALLFSLWPGFNPLPWLVLISAIASIHALYIFRGWQLCPLGISALFTLSLAPFFVLWKLGVLLKGHGKAHWVRTQRNSDLDIK